MAVAVVWSAVLATLIVGPMMRGGWVLLLDWVTGPEVTYADRIGAGSSLPAGPVFFGGAAVLQWLFGAAVGWLLPWCTLVLAGVGAARLAGVGAPERRPSDRRPSDGWHGGWRGMISPLTAVTAYVWNPFVHERLYAGQLGVLLGYAILPFLARAALHAFDTEGSDEIGGERGRGTRRGTHRSCAILGATWAVGTAASIHFAVLGAVVVGATFAAVAIVRRKIRWRELLVGTAVVLALTGAWLLPRVSNAPATGNDETVDAFATRADPHLGLAAGVALQSGFWRPSLGEPNSTSGWWFALAGGTMGGATLVGYAALWTRRRSLAVTGAVLGAVGWLLGQGANGIVGPLFTSLTHVPGMRVMREAGKFISLVSLATTIGLAAFAHVVAGLLPLHDRGGRGADQAAVARVGARLATVAGRLAGLAVLAVAALPVMPAALTPGLFWGVGGRLAAVRYPPAWFELRATLDGEDNGRAAGSVIVLPFIGYLNPGFTNGRIVRNPALSFFGNRVRLSDNLGVLGLEPSTATLDVEMALNDPDPATSLAAVGVRWVICGPTDGDWIRDSLAERPCASNRLNDFEEVRRADGWVLFRVGALTLSGDAQN